MSKIYLYDGKAYTEEKIKKFNNFNSGYSNNPVLVYELSSSWLKKFVTIQKQKERDMQLTVLLDESDEYKYDFIYFYL
jgi:hypothetical protein